MVYGVRSIARDDERRWALAVLNHVLGGGLSSRLFQKVREERGLAYSIWSERAAYQDAGSLAIVAGTAPEHVDEVLRIVAGELELLAEHGITDRELAVAKGNLRAELLLSGEDSGARMSRIGASVLLHGEVRPVDEVLARIDAIGRDEVAAEDVWPSPRARSARSGPSTRRPWRRLTFPPCQAGRVFSCTRSAWWGPAGGWAPRCAAPSPRPPTWSWWPPSIRVGRVRWSRD